MDGSGTGIAAATMMGVGINTGVPVGMMPVFFDAFTVGLYVDTTRAGNFAFLPSDIHVAPFWLMIVVAPVSVSGVSNANAESKRGRAPGGIRTFTESRGGVMPRRMCGLSS